MAGKWAETTLGRLLSFANGRSSPERADGLPYPVYGSNGVIGRAAAPNSDAGSIVIGRVGSYCGSLYLSKERCWVTDNAIRATALDDNDSRFLFYLLGTLSLNNWRAGSGQPLLNQDILSRIPAAVPEPVEQRAIAHILGTLDDKIALNRRMSETLEAMARALFKSWFVDFDPVRAKAQGRDPGLPKPLADLFPARLVDSELGEIPEGWEWGTFDAVVELRRETENPLESPDVAFRHFSIPAYDEGQWPKHEVGESIKSLKARVPAGVVLLSKLNPEIERVWLVDVQPGDRAICSTEFLVLVPRPPHGRSHVYCLARSQSFRQELEGLVTGTSKSHQRAQAAAILGLAVVRPPESLLRRFEQAAEPLLARTLECRRESRTLAALRDALLPKLISGEIRIGDAEKFIGRAV
ncbi:MAG: restriction endonuclease subunit S [Deltaproteobacteria bacterium]|nr:restriction endonuclease subunit S [Deltaproteobacteria bacterium]